MTIPYYSEPEFLLLAGDDRWNVRNRPAGTVAAGYGHTDDAIHDALMSTGRYEPMARALNAAPLDVAVLSPGEFRQSSWHVIRSDDGSVTVAGPVETGLPGQWRFAPLAVGESYVGGTVLGDSGGFPSVLLVRNDGALVRSRVNENGTITAPQVVGTVGGPAVAAVSRSYTEYDKSSRLGGITDEAPQTTSTLMMVLRSDGSLVPLQVGFFDGDVTLGATQRQALPFNVSYSTPALIDFDFSCATFAASLAGGNGATGRAAQLIGCPPGTTGPGEDPLSLGRISVAVAFNIPGGTQTAASVNVYTLADFGSEASNGLWSITTEQPAELGCIWTLPVNSTTGGGAAEVPAGSFDVRTVTGVTHLACVESSPLYDDLTVTDYMQPASAMPYRRSSGPSTARTSEVNEVRVEPERVTYDRFWEPEGPRQTAKLPLIRDRYSSFASPSIQLQFPCAQLLARPSRPGTFIDDCDTSTTSLQVPTGAQPVAPPPNWKTYTIAAYATAQTPAGPERRLVVANAAAETSPQDRTLDSNATPSPFGEDARENFAWTIEPAPFLASDLADIKGDADVDVSTLDRYIAPPAASAPPLFLASVPRPARSPMVVELTSEQPVLETSPSVPVAILQAPPTVDGLGQQEDFTPEFATSSTDTTSTGQGKSTRIGAHVEGSVVGTGGAGFLGNNARAGGGISVGFEFMNEVEKSLEESVETSRTEGYGGSFDDHTVVTRAVKEYVWPGRVVSDPTGLASGQQFTYRLPAGEVTQALPLAQLKESQPGLYAQNGLFDRSLRRILGGIDIGDPSTYLPGADVSEPRSILEINGGPCRGDFTPPDNETSFDGDLPAVVSPENPYFSKPPAKPTGPNVLTSSEHVVSLGNALTESATIGVGEATERALATSKSFDFSASAIIKTELEASAGGSSKLETELRFGVDAGWSTSASVTESLAEGSELSMIMGNIPFSAADVGPWISGESYTWRMFMCKAQLGPAGIGQQVWVQGYVTDGYAGSGGITDLEPVTAEAPKASPVVLADPTGQPSATMMACTPGSRPDANRFEWDSPAGTMKSYEIQLENVSGGGAARLPVRQWDEPKQFNDSVQRDPDDDRPGLQPRPSCADVPASDFTDGDLYRWRMVTDGFVLNQERSDWEYLRPQVWPPSQQIRLRLPLVNADNSVSIDIVDPPNVSSLRHEVVVRSMTSGEVVDQATNVRDRFRSIELPDGRYEATVIGYNSHRLADGHRAETPAQTVQFRIGRPLTAQFSVTCASDPCAAGTDITFADLSKVDDASIVAWEWDFGDGTTSSERSPVHRYSKASGTNGYLVSLVVTDSTGRTDTASQQVPVVAPPSEDADGDGVVDGADNCSVVPNPGQEDADRDGTGNACDLTPNGDRDGDGVGDEVDNCPVIPNAGQADTDGDGTGDRCDTTPRGGTPEVDVSNAPDVREQDAPTPAIFTVRLDRPTDRTVAVNFTTRNGTAVAGQDYVARAGTLIWQPGEQVKKVRVRVRADSRPERTENFWLRLVGPVSGLVISDGVGRARIIDDDR